VLVPVMSILLAVVISYEGWRQITRSSRQYENALLSAEQASRSKDNFLATVSHELRNPLNTILLRFNLLLTTEPLGETGRRGVMILERAAKAQAQLIEDLLDVSRIESGRLGLDLQAVDLVEVVKAAVEAMRVAADAKSITLQEAVDPRISPIAGDPQRLQQVVWNLISNAVKFTPRGGRIQLRLERINSHIEIVVADSGKGIESSQLGHVFDRFWQAQDLAKGETGIGLGLSIVKHIVTLQGGTVIAQSDGLGKGSRFTVRLPLPISSAALDDRSRRHPTVAPPTNADDPGRLDGLSILVADDDETACQALQELLISRGAKVATASSVDEALAKMGRFHSDLVICDIGMPVRDGISMAREVRRREQDSGGQVQPL
jgi:signal transduction histidine kinase